MCNLYLVAKSSSWGVGGERGTVNGSIVRSKRDGTRAETIFRLSAKRTSPLKSAGASVQSTAGSRGVRISGSNAGYTKFRSSVRDTGYPLHWPVSPSLPLPCVTVCHHVSTGLYDCWSEQRGGPKRNMATKMWSRVRRRPICLADASCRVGGPCG